MNEANGGGLESRLSKIEQIQAQLQDAMLVHATLEATAARRIREHAQWLVDNETSMTQHRIKMDEFDGKLNALIDILDRQQSDRQQNGH